MEDVLIQVDKFYYPVDFVVLFFWIIKNLLPKGKNPQQQKTNKEPKATAKSYRKKMKNGQHLP